jgi:ABC-type multidrug transport system fused ATPase/permease subunit
LLLKYAKYAYSDEFRAVVSPYIVLTAAVLFIVSLYFSVFYLASARDTRRLESTAKSPIFEHFNAALQGVSTIRAFEKKEPYIQAMFDKLDQHARTLYHLNVYKRWLGWRLAIVGAIFTIIGASFILAFKGMDAALGGFALTFMLSYNDSIFWLLRHFVEVELGMNSTERIVEYAEMEIESQAGKDVPASWPSTGSMEVNDLVVGYAPDLPPVLKGLTFKVQARERVGVVGRTGAGKSSLTLAIFRFLEAREGVITVDGIDISKIKLMDLRSRLAIIPQDPVLFSGTIRSNLDPFNERSDSELHDALRRVHLVDDENSPSAQPSGSTTPGSATQTTQRNTNTNIFRSLNSSVAESGQNLSQGQRQLLCLARAIVARPKIMVLDEATSAVDKTTDSLIQRSIREEFNESTLLVIAHRLSTIADFDRILVLDDGCVVEYGTPKELLALKDPGVFAGMVQSSGERDALISIING